MNTKYLNEWLLALFLTALNCDGVELPHVSWSNAQEVVLEPVTVEIPSPDGNIQGLLFKITLAKSASTWAPLVNLLYLPQTGYAWTGHQQFERDQAALDDRIFGFEYWSGQGNEQLYLSVSTNHYESNVKDVSQVVRQELALYKAGRGRTRFPRYVVQLEPLLGSTVLRDNVLPSDKGLPERDTLSVVTRPSKLQRISVEGTNVVAAIEFGTNMLAKISFDKNVRPIWATTNGVSIGPIPTNTVSYLEDKPDGKLAVRVVY